MNAESTLLVYTDGGSRGNPGLSAIGVYVTRQTGEVLYAAGKELGIATNNIAEYTAVLEALSWIRQHKHELGTISKVKCYADSQLVVSQLNGIYKIKSVHLRQLLFKIRVLEAQLLVPVSYTYIPREKNKHADRLVNMALDKKL